MLRSTRVRAAAATALVSTLVTMPPIGAQIVPAPMAFAALREVQPEPGPSREWRMTLRAASTAGTLAQLPPPASRQLAIARVPERDPELTPDSLVIVALDAAGITLDWEIVHDPRVIRAESPGADGLLSGQTLTSETAEVRAVLNGGDQTTELRVFKPRWNGRDWLLEPIATARVAR